MFWTYSGSQESELFLFWTLNYFFLATFVLNELLIMCKGFYICGAQGFGSSVLSKDTWTVPGGARDWTTDPAAAATP